ncbi:MAG: endo-1,3-alpha-glucanase family glycosylhydrolase [candidate division FCPU426 bacterium]
MKRIAAVIGIFLALGAGGCQQAMVHVSPGEVAFQPGAEPPAVLAYYFTGYETPVRSNRWRFWSWEQKPRRHNPDRMFPDGRRDIAGIHYPLIEPYDSIDEDVIEYHMLLAKAAGLDGFVVDWYGFNNEFGQPRYEDQVFRKMLALAERLKFKVCLSFEDKSMFPPFQRLADRKASVALAQQTIAQACRQYGQQPGYFKLDGRPVLTGYNWNLATEEAPQNGAFTVSEWQRILAGMGPKRPVLISNVHWHWNRSLADTRYAEVADSLYPWVANSCKQLDRFYTEEARLVAGDKLKFLSGVVCPGADNFGTWGGDESRTIVPRKNGEVYKNTWRESLKHKPRWIQIATWNDFPAGSTIEPSREYEYQYLEITSDFASAIHGQQPDYQALRVPKKIFDAKRELRELSQTKAANRSVLDLLQKDIGEAVDLMAGNQTRQADALISQTLRGLAGERAKVQPEPELIVTLEPEKLSLHAGEAKYFWVEVKNATPKAVRGRIKLDSDRDLPADWFNQSTMPVDLNPRQKTKLPFRIKVPEEAGNIKALLEAQLYAGGKFIRSRVSTVDVVTPYFNVDVGSRNLYQLGEEAEVRVLLAGLEEDSGKIQLIAPAGWQVRPVEVEYTLVPDQPSEAVFWVKPTTSQAGLLTASVKSRTQGQVRVQEPVQALRGGETVALQGDVDNDGETDFVLGNRRVEVHVSSTHGGRITGFFLKSDGGDNQLFYDPNLSRQRAAAETDQWIEYGGINDTFPLNWPGEVWNNRWPTRIVESGPGKGLEQTTRAANGLALTRQLRLRDDSPRLEAVYLVKNTGSKKIKYRWHNHPDLSPGPNDEAQRSIRIQVPQSGGVVNVPFSGNLTKEHYPPSQNWCLTWDSESDEYFLQQFDARRVEKIGVWQGRNFFTMEIISREAVLEPGATDRFRVDYIAGKGDWENQLPLFSTR